MAVTISGSGPVTGLTTINSITVPTSTFGKILQVVSTSYSTAATNATSTYADTGLSLSITPSSATSKVFVVVSQMLATHRSNAASSAVTGGRILRGATAIFTNDYACLTRAGLNTQGHVDLSVSVSLTCLDSPNTTSATTYKTQFAVAESGSDATAQLAGAPSVMTLMEVAA